MYNILLFVKNVNSCSVKSRTFVFVYNYFSYFCAILEIVFFMVSDSGLMCLRLTDTWLNYFP